MILESPRSNVGRHRHPALAANLAALVSFGMVGCTPSGPGPGDANWVGVAGTEGEAAVVIGVPAGTELPLSALEDLAEGAGVTIEEVTLAPPASGSALTQEAIENVDLLLAVDPLWMEASGLDLLDSARQGPDADTQSSVVYGTERACVLLNRTWFSANNLAFPADISSLDEEQLRAIVAGANPRFSPQALALLPAWSNEFKTWTPGPLSAPAQILPGTIGRSLPSSGENVEGGSGRYQALDSPCVQREVYAVIVATRSDRANVAQRLADFLLTENGQETLTNHGIILPLSEEDGGAQSGGMEEAVDADGAPTENYTPSQVWEALAAWDRLFSPTETD